MPQKESISSFAQNRGKLRDMCFADVSGQVRREALANPLEPNNPSLLCKPPIFSDRFTFRRRHSDGFLHNLWANLVVAELVRKPPGRVDKPKRMEKRSSGNA